LMQQICIVGEVSAPGSSRYISCATKLHLLFFQAFAILKILCQNCIVPGSGDTCFVFK
jgi:hypothetical protein